MDIFTTAFYNKAHVPKRDACDILAQVYKWNFDCSIFANGKR